MPQCKHYEICRRDAEENSEEGLCILHSQNPYKDREKFDKALAAHGEEKGSNFQHFLFPEHAVYFKGARFTDRAVFFFAKFAEGCDFSDAIFSEGADFSRATFAERAKFVGVSFDKGVKFSGATFYEGTYVDFRFAKFADWAYFSNATFGVEKVANPANVRWINESLCTDAAIYAAEFDDAIFLGEAYFDGAIFSEQAWFDGATFAKGADFSRATFGKKAKFSRARFLGRTRFFSRQENGRRIPVFSGTPVDFREADMAPDAVVFQDADLRKCVFLGTDLRKTWFANVAWPEERGRYEVYDQVEAERKGQNDKWPHIEELYRELKQNYEDRRNFELARDFHYGEKEMRRRNSRGWLWSLLTLYRWVSGYGESCLLPLFWLVILFVATTTAYVWGNLLTLDNTTSILDVGIYSLRVMTLLKPIDFIPNGPGGNFVNWIQTIFGPILLGFFALALRQRLKR